MIAGGFGLLVSCFGLFIGLMVGSVIVRAAVSIANRMIGPIKTDDFGQWDDWDSDEEPAYVRNRRRGGEKAIPEPGFGTGILVTFVAGVVHLFVGVVLAFLTGDLLEELIDDDELVKLAVVILSLPVVFTFTTLLIRPILSTTFWRAAAVNFLCYLIVIGIVALIVGMIYAAWILTKP